MDELRLTSGLIEEMLAHATAHYPEETCGLLGGRDGQAMLFIPIENDLHSTVAYRMEPQQQVQAMLAIDAAGMEIVAIYHSHPGGPARPSATDVVEANYPDSTQIIISLADRMRPEVRAYTIRDGQVKAIELSTTA